MIVNAREENGIIVTKHETHLECANCGMEVDAEEYNSGTCSDCGAPWNARKYMSVHVTSVPASGESG